MLGAAYDVLRIWRDFLHSPKRAVFFQDFFYMVLCAFFSFLLALPLGEGAVRVYLLAGEAVGWFVYYFTVGQVTARVSRLLSGFLYRHVFNPAGRLLRRAGSSLLRKWKSFLKFLKKKTPKRKKRLKPHRAIVYNHGGRFFCGRRKRKVVRKDGSARKAKT